MTLYTQRTFDSAIKVKNYADHEIRVSTDGYFLANLGDKIYGSRSITDVERELAENGPTGEVRVVTSLPTLKYARPQLRTDFETITGSGREPGCRRSRYEQCLPKWISKDRTYRLSRGLTFYKPNAEAQAALDALQKEIYESFVNWEERLKGITQQFEVFRPEEIQAELQRQNIERNEREIKKVP